MAMIKDAFEAGLQEKTERPLMLVRPMRYADVPDINARYWVAITLASICGCNLGDFFSYYNNWNHLVGLIPLSIAFLILLAGEHRSSASTEAWYWTAVLVLRAAATNLADLATHTFGWSYPKVIAGLSALQLLAASAVAPRLAALGADGAPRPAAGGWYWLSLLTAGTLGTVIGDWTAEGLHLGTGISTLVLGGIFLIVLMLGRQSRWIPKLAYWSSMVAVRAAGTTAGDWLAFRDDPGLDNGLHLGLALSTALTCALFAVTLASWKASSGLNRIAENVRMDA